MALPAAPAPFPRRALAAIEARPRPAVALAAILPFLGTAREPAGPRRRRSSEKILEAIQMAWLEEVEE